MVTPIYTNRKGIYKDLYREIDADNKKREKAKAKKLNKGIYVDLYRQLENDKKAINFEHSRKPETAKEEDVFHKYPLKALIYSNNVGESIKPLIGALWAKLSFIPAIIYAFFAVLSKCPKSQENENKPKSNEVAKEISFQLLASFILPHFVIKATQKVTNKLIDKISSETKEAIKNTTKTMDLTHKLLMKFKADKISGHRNFGLSTMSLVALAVSVKPIDHFVEHSLDRFYNNRGTT